MQIKLIHKKMKGLGVGDVGPTAMTIGFAIIVVAVLAYVLANFQTAFTTGGPGNNLSTNASNIIGDGLTAMSTFGDWFTIIVIVVVSVIVLSLIALIRMRSGSRA